MVQYRLGSLLVHKGLIQQEQLEEALAFQRTQQGMPLGQALINLGFVNQKQIQKALRKQTRIRLCAAVMAFFMAPFNWCQASDDELEQLPEYQYTQVHDQLYFDDAQEFALDSADVGIDLLEVSSSAAWYLYQSDGDMDKLDDMPVKLNLAKGQGSDFKLQLTIEF